MAFSLKIPASRHTVRGPLGIQRDFTQTPRFSIHADDPAAVRVETREQVPFKSAVVISRTALQNALTLSPGDAKSVSGPAAFWRDDAGLHMELQTTSGPVEYVYQGEALDSLRTFATKAEEIATRANDAYTDGGLGRELELIAPREVFTEERSALKPLPSDDEPVRLWGASFRRGVTNRTENVGHNTGDRTYQEWGKSEGKLFFDQDSPEVVRVGKPTGRYAVSFPRELLRNVLEAAPGQVLAEGGFRMVRSEEGLVHLELPSRELQTFPAADAVTFLRRTDKLAGPAPMENPRPAIDPAQVKEAAGFSSEQTTKAQVEAAMADPEGWVFESKYLSRWGTELFRTEAMAKPQWHPQARWTKDNLLELGTVWATSPIGNESSPYKMRIVVDPQRPEEMGIRFQDTVSKNRRWFQAMCDGFDRGVSHLHGEAGPEDELLEGNFQSASQFVEAHAFDNAGKNWSTTGNPDRETTWWFTRDALAKALKEPVFQAAKEGQPGIQAQPDLMGDRLILRQVTDKPRPAGGNGAHTFELSLPVIDEALKREAVANENTPAPSLGDAWGGSFDEQWAWFNKTGVWPDAGSGPSESH